MSNAAPLICLYLCATLKGPMFEIYNGLLRAYGNKPRGIVPSYALVGAGKDVRGRFTTTLHVLNSGVLKLAKLQVRPRIL